MSFFQSLFGSAPAPDYALLKKEGALLLDVRSPAEHAAGSIAGALNIPLNELNRRLAELPKDRAIIAFCASGNRSGQACSLLQAQGYAQVHNGGGWMSLKNKL